MSATRTASEHALTGQPFTVEDTDTSRDHHESARKPEETKPYTIEDLDRQLTIGNTITTKLTTTGNEGDAGMCCVKASDDYRPGTIPDHPTPPHRRPFMEEYRGTGGPHAF